MKRGKKRKEKNNIRQGHKTEMKKLGTIKKEIENEVEWHTFFFLRNLN